jgi:hypothetical protein
MYQSAPAPGRLVFGYAAAAVFLLLPSLLFGTLISHSSPLNLTWAAQFAEQFRAFVPYPRWMPWSFDGLGSPAFYFYPPLPFWIDALASVVTANLLSVPYRLAVSAALVLFASGLAMHAWLKQETGRPRAAFWGALVYMAAPYHLLDHYMRGAFAEFTAYVFLPLILLAIRRPVPLALAYAGLLATHLPTALLVSVTVLPAFVLTRMRTPREVLGVAAGIALGIGLAAVYLVPAMTLQGWVSAERLWSSFYAVDNWFLFVPQRWPEPSIMWVVVLLAAAYGLLALALSLHPGGARLWVALCFLCLVLMSGLVPWFWQLPELAKVQFPWRLMVVVEFAVITAFCGTPVRNPPRAIVYLLGLAALALAFAEILSAGDMVLRLQRTLEHPSLVRRDAKEYQPHGFPQSTNEDIADIGLQQVANVAPITCTPAARVCRADSAPFGALTIEIESEAPTIVVVRRFFFPAWHVTPMTQIVPTDPLRLVSFTAGAGQHTYSLQRVALPEEQIGWAISGLSLVLLIAWSVLRRRGIKAA